jgi:hypothetical protein
MRGNTHTLCMYSRWATSMGLLSTPMISSSSSGVFHFRSHSRSSAFDPSISSSRSRSNYPRCSLLPKSKSSTGMSNTSFDLFLFLCLLVDDGSFSFFFFCMTREQERNTWGAMTLSEGGRGKGGRWDGYVNPSRSVEGLGRLLGGCNLLLCSLELGE